MRHNRSRTAYHEAGHAVVAFHEGLPVDVVTVEPGRGSWGHVQPTRIEREDPETQSDPEDFDLAIRRARCLLAGHIAQRKQCPRSKAGNSEDNRILLDLLGYFVAWEGPVLSAYIKALGLEAEARVLRLWPAVEALAGVLEAKTTLTGDQALEVCHTAEAHLVPPYRFPAHGYAEGYWREAKEGRVAFAMLDPLRELLQLWRERMPQDRKLRLLSRKLKVIEFNLKCADQW